MQPLYTSTMTIESPETQLSHRQPQDDRDEEPRRVGHHGEHQKVSDERLEREQHGAGEVDRRDEGWGLGPFVVVGCLCLSDDGGLVERVGRLETSGGPLERDRLTPAAFARGADGGEDAGEDGEEEEAEAGAKGSAGGGGRPGGEPKIRGAEAGGDGGLGRHVKEQM
jgi:hypothetical protein